MTSPSLPEQNHRELATLTLRTFRNTFFSFKQIADPERVGSGIGEYVSGERRLRIRKAVPVSIPIPIPDLFFVPPSFDRIKQKQRDFEEEEEKAWRGPSSL